MKTLARILLLCMAVTAGCSSSETDPQTKKPSPAEHQLGQVADADTGTAPVQEKRKEQKLAEPMPPVAVAPLASPEAAGRNTVQGLPASAAKALSRESALWYPPSPPPNWNRESYNAIKENGFINAGRDPLSTFSIDVDTASYANVRRFVTGGSLPPMGAVRIEEMVNYFSYDYPKPKAREPFALSAEIGTSPFHHNYKLARIGLAAKDLTKEQLPASNLVFLIDVSGSMQDANKLPLLKQALSLLVRQLGSRDRVAMVVYAGADRIVLLPTGGDRQQEILAAINQLQAGGSTHASSGIRTAYDLTRRSFIKGGNNRVILASDGDFNVGVTSRDELTRLIEEERKAGVYLTVLGFGMGNYHDDTMEVLADKGNGNYAYIDSLLEAKKVLVKEMSGTLFALANDVKIQVEFNPARVGAYRLIGYENRALADEDFKDDSKDAGEIGVGHRVTALYELIPAGHSSIPQLDPLKYQSNEPATAPSRSGEWMTVKLRYKPQGEKNSTQMNLAVRESDKEPSADFRFASAVAGYGMLLTHSEHLGEFSWQRCLEMARSGRGSDEEGYRAEFYRLVEASELLAKRREPETRDGDDRKPIPTGIR